MGRTLLTRRWMLRSVLLAVLLAAFTWLGFWQLGVAYSKGKAEALAAQKTIPEAELTSVVEPHQPFPDGGMNRPVRVRGTYEPAGQLLVPHRRLDGVNGLWVLTPLRVDSTGAKLPVVRGFVPDGAAAPAPPTGPVELKGSLAQPEGKPERFDVAADQIAAVDPGSLVNRWDGEIYNAFVFGQAEVPAPELGTLRRVPPPELTHTGVNWRNFFYALQWWAFGVMAIYIFVRVLREEAAGTRGDGTARLAADTAQNQEHP